MNAQQKLENLKGEMLMYRGEVLLSLNGLSIVADWGLHSIVDILKRKVMETHKQYLDGIPTEFLWPAQLIDMLIRRSMIEERGVEPSKPLATELLRHFAQHGYSRVMGEAWLKGSQASKSPNDVKSWPKGGRIIPEELTEFVKNSENLWGACLHTEKPEPPISKPLGVFIHYRDNFVRYRLPESEVTASIFFAGNPVPYPDNALLEALSELTLEEGEDIIGVTSNGSVNTIRTYMSYEDWERYHFKDLPEWLCSSAKVNAETRRTIAAKLLLRCIKDGTYIMLEDRFFKPELNKLAQFYVATDKLKFPTGLLKEYCKLGF